MTQDIPTAYNLKKKYSGSYNQEIFTEVNICCNPVTDIFDCINHVLVTEWDPNISPWTLSYAQDPGCKHEHHS